MLKTLVSKFRPDLSVCLKDIAEKKQVPVKLKPIVGIQQRKQVRHPQLFSKVDAPASKYHSRLGQHMYLRSRSFKITRSRKGQT